MDVVGVGNCLRGKIASERCKVNILILGTKWFSISAPSGNNCYCLEMYDTPVGTLAYL